ncbi:MAG: aspartate aminotransferase family protein [Woeseiaceae bacterium]
MSDPHQQGAPRAGAVFYRSPRHVYPVAVSASGMTITDAGGKSYLDMSGGAAVSCLGHAHPDVVAAVQRQLATLAFAHTAFFTNEPQEKLASLLAARFGEANARVYFASGGSEANETALKLAWQYWAARGRPQKKVVISREHSYHGNTFGVLSVSGNDLRRRASAAPLIDWPRIPPCYEYRERRADESPADYAQRAAAYLEQAIIETGAEQVSAFICEPVVGSSLGVVPAASGYLQRVREICNRHDVLLVADEIMCGSGRTGRYFAHEHDGALPDLVTLAKGIGGGYQPLAAVVIREHVASAFADTGFAHGHTYIGHASACAAGVAVQQVLDRNGLLERTAVMGAAFLAMLGEAFAEHRRVGEVRGRGLFCGIELVKDRANKEGFANGSGLPDALRLAAMDEGLICYPGGIQVDGHTVPHIMLAPPMLVEERHMAECIDKLRKVLQRTLPAD